MLVIVHDGYVESTLEPLLNIETFRSFYVLKVYSAERWRNLLYSLAEFLRIFLINLNIEDVDTTINLEQQPLTLHNGFSTHRTYIAQSEYGCAIRYHSYKVSLVGILVDIVGGFLDFQTWICHSG